MSPQPSSIAAHHGAGAPAAAVGAFLPALLAGLLGALLILGVGFVQIEAVHNAAHDARHANGFPCH